MLIQSKSVYIFGLSLIFSGMAAACENTSSLETPQAHSAAVDDESRFDEEMMASFATLRSQLDDSRWFFYGSETVREFYDRVIGGDVLPEEAPLFCSDASLLHDKNAMMNCGLSSSVRTEGETRAWKYDADEQLFFFETVVDVADEAAAFFHESSGTHIGSVSPYESFAPILERHNGQGDFNREIAVTAGSHHISIWFNPVHFHGSTVSVNCESEASCTLTSRNYFDREPSLWAIKSKDEAESLGASLRGRFDDPNEYPSFYQHLGGFADRIHAFGEQNLGAIEQFARCFSLRSGAICGVEEAALALPAVVDVSSWSETVTKRWEIKKSVGDVVEFHMTLAPQTEYQQRFMTYGLDGDPRVEQFEMYTQCNQDTCFLIQEVSL
jgi:hypothetical protein